MKKCKLKYDEYYSIEHLTKLDDQVDMQQKGVNTKQFNETRIKGLRDGAMMMYKFKIEPVLKQSVKFNSPKNMVKLRLRSITVNRLDPDKQNITKEWNKSFIDMMINIIEEVMPDDSK